MYEVVGRWAHLLSVVPDGIHEGSEERYQPVKDLRGLQRLHLLQVRLLSRGAGSGNLRGKVCLRLQRAIGSVSELDDRHETYDQRSHRTNCSI